MAKEQSSKTHKLLTIIGSILCVILTPVLILNVTLIIKNFTNSTEVPSVGGYLPLIVLTDSMYPEIHSGDLIICHQEDSEDIQVGDVIAFFDPVGTGTSVVTHRVTEVVREGDSIFWRTKGDANNIEDTALVPAENLVGVYQSRIGGLGNVVMFMQSPQGLILCVIFPMLLLVGYDVVRRRLYEKTKQQDTEALLKELEELRARKAAEEKNGIDR